MMDSFRLFVVLAEVVDELLHRPEMACVGSAMWSMAGIGAFVIHGHPIFLIIAVIFSPAWSFVVPAKDETEGLS